MNDLNDGENSDDQPIGFTALTLERDLWPDIASAIAEPKKRHGYRLTGGIAASFLVGLLAFFVSTDSGQGTLMQQSAQRMLAEHRSQTGSMAPGGYQDFEEAFAELGRAESAVLAEIDRRPDQDRLLRLLANVQGQRTSLLAKSIKVKEYL